MHLCIDIGNSNSKLAVFKGEEMVFYERVKKILIRQLKEIQRNFRFKKVIYSVTGEISDAVLRHLRKNYHLIELSHLTKIPIKNNYKTPETLGRDRIAGVVGAYSLYPNKNNLVIDIGTCITYDFINDKNVYLGGNIAPGVDLRLMAMDKFTSKLPTVSKKRNKNILGLTTETAMQNGAIWGTKCEIEAFIRMLKDSYGEINVILTGGDARFFAEMIKTKIFVAPNLVLQGLNKILAFNDA